MSSSLEKLANNLPSEKFYETKRNNNVCSDKLKLLLRKGVYCYDLTDTLEKLKIKNLPSKADFYSSLLES
jgi:hypothetical protein